MKNKKAILLISNSDGAMFNFRKHLIYSLIEKGFEVTVLCGPSPEGDYAPDLQNMGVKVIKTRSFKGVIFKAFSMAINEDFRTVHGFTHVGILAAIFFSLKRWTNVFVTFTGLGRAFGQDQIKLLGWFIIGVHMLFRRRIRHYFFQNPDDAGLFERWAKLPTSKITVVNGSGVDVNEYIEKTTYSAVLKRVAYVGRIIEEKGVRDFIEARKYFDSSVTFEVYGSFSFLSGIDDENSFIEYCASENVSYFGYIGDMVGLLSEIDVLVLPSYYREGIPRTLIEAASCGVPIVTCNTVGNREAVVDGYNGLYCEIKSPTSIANCLKIIAGDISLYGRRSREHALKNFDVNVITKTTLSKYFEFGLNYTSTR